MSKYDVILDVYENQSISKAAQKHNYTQSAVSQTIRNYEKEICERSAGCSNGTFHDRMRQQQQRSRDNRSRYRGG